MSKPRAAQYANTSSVVQAAIGFQSTPLVQRVFLASRSFSSDVGASLRSLDSSRRTPHALMMRLPGKRRTSAAAIGCDFSSLVQNRMPGVDHGRMIVTHESAA